MNEELKKKLINALKKAGLAEGLVATFEGQEDAQIEAFISGLTPASETTITPQEFIKGEAFTNFIKNGGFDLIASQNKTFQGVYDKKLGKAMYNFKKNLLDGDGGGEPSGGEDGNDADLTKLLGGSGVDPNNPLVQLLGKVLGEVQSLKNQNQTASKLDQAKAAMASTKLPDSLKESWLSRIDLNSETPFSEQAEALSTEYETITGGAGGNGDQNQQSGSYSFQQRQTPRDKMTKTEEADLEAMAEKM